MDYNEINDNENDGFIPDEQESISERIDSLCGEIPELRSVLNKNERFYGKNIDPEKLARLVKIRKLCKQIAEIEPDVSASVYPFGNKNRNSMVFIDLPDGGFDVFDRRVMECFSALFNLADAFSLSTLGETPRLTFSIMDMWLDYDYEKEQK